MGWVAPQLAVGDLSCIIDKPIIVISPVFKRVESVIFEAALRQIETAACAKALCVVGWCTIGDAFGGTSICVAECMGLKKLLAPSPCHGIRSGLAVLLDLSEFEVCGILEDRVMC